MPSLECRHPCCSGEKCRKKTVKPKKVYTLKRTPIKKKPYTIKKVSDKRKVELQEYSALRKEFLTKNPTCNANLSGCTKQATEIHHMNGRDGSMLTYVGFFMPICRSCHNYITEHSDWAIKVGFSVRRIT